MTFDRATRAWVESVLGARVERTRVLHGGISATMHRLDTHLGSFVLRRQLRTAVAEEDESQYIRREALALTALAGHRLVAELVVADPDGEALGVPASIQALLPGRPATAPRDIGRWLDGMADAIRLAPAASVDLAPFEPYESWIPKDLQPRPWASDSAAWQSAIDRFKDGPPPGGATGLLHRDLHPLDVLFHRGRLSGVVDWTNACVGPPEVDISRCRAEVALTAGIEAADALLERCQLDYDRAWDAFVVLELGNVGPGFLLFNRFGSSLTIDGIRRTLDELLMRALRAR